MEPEGSLPHSQVPVTCPYPKPARSSPCPHIPLPEYPSSCCYPIYPWVFQMVSIPQVSPPKSCRHPSCPPIRATCPAYLILLDFINRTILGEEYRSLSSSLYSFLHSPVISSLLDPNILLNTLFSNTLSLRSSLSVNDQVSHPYKTTDKIRVLYILIFKFLDSKLEDDDSAPNDSKHSLSSIVAVLIYFVKCVLKVATS